MIPVSDPEIERKIVRYELAKRSLIVATSVMVAICLGILLVLAAQGASRGKENRETLQTIRDCTQPTGTCYKDSQKRTGDAVASINKVVILAAACAGQRPGQSVSEIQACVINRLSAHKH